MKYDPTQSKVVAFMALWTQLRVDAIKGWDKYITRQQTDAVIASPKTALEHYVFGKQNAYVISDAARVKMIHTC